MNWDNQNNQDPWGRKDQDEGSFDDLIKKFSVMFGKQGSGSNGSSGGNGFNFPTKKAFLYGFFGLLVIYASMSIYQLDSPERAVVLRFGEYHEETGEGLNFMLAGIDERYVENVALTRRYSQTANMLTKDENLVDVTISVQYRIKNLKDFVLNVRDPVSSLREATESSFAIIDELGRGTSTFDGNILNNRNGYCICSFEIYLLKYKMLYYVYYSLS